MSDATDTRATELATVAAEVMVAVWDVVTFHRGDDIEVVKVEEIAELLRPFFAEAVALGQKRH